jgi:ATPase subunit of ABC transporter with duplicated ATPase domains
MWGTGNKALMKKSLAIDRRAARLTVTQRPVSEKSIGARFSERDFHSDEAIVAKSVSKSYGNKPLFHDVSFTVAGGERIALIGDNGAGKTTLIRIITGHERPDSGFSRLGPAVKAAVLPQIVSFANPRLSALDTLLTETNCSSQTARNRLGAFKFSGEEVFKPVGDLSGGERSRLKLCCLMSGDINLLILDEPTNHLDIASREWIEQAVSDYGGILLFVSHDRYFVNRFASRIWRLDGGVFTDFRGGFEEYLQAFRAPDPPAARPGGARREHAAARVSPGREARAALRRLTVVEREIDESERLLRELDLDSLRFGSDYKHLLELESRRRELSGRLDDLYGLWEHLSAETQT